MPTTATDLLLAIKSRMQTQQDIVGGRGGETPQLVTLGTLQVLRAEMDALWEAVEALAAVIDGVPVSNHVPRDYSRESGRL